MAVCVNMCIGDAFSLGGMDPEGMERAHLGPKFDWGSVSFEAKSGAHGVFAATKLCFEIGYSGSFRRYWVRTKRGKSGGRARLDAVPVGFEPVCCTSYTPILLHRGSYPWLHRLSRGFFQRILYVNCVVWRVLLVVAPPV